MEFWVFIDFSAIVSYTGIVIIGRRRKITRNDHLTSVGCSVNECTIVTHHRLLSRNILFYPQVTHSW